MLPLPGWLTLCDPIYGMQATVAQTAIRFLLITSSPPSPRTSINASNRLALRRGISVTSICVAPCVLIELLMALDSRVSHLSAKQSSL